MSEPMPEPTDHLPATRRAALLAVATDVSGLDPRITRATVMRIIRERAGDYPEHDTIDPTVSVDTETGWLTVTWPDAVTGPVLVQREFVNRMVAAQNGMLRDLAEARAALDEATAMLTAGGAEVEKLRGLICGKPVPRCDVHLSPDCTASKHDACSDDAWCPLLDRPTPCGCACHVPPEARVS